MTTSSSSADASGARRAPIVGVKESLVTIDVSNTPVRKNEVGHILLGEERLKAEVLRIQGGVADLQVFEDTSGVRIGDQVELTGEMLSVVLGPGLLGSVFDGLEMPLETLAADHGFFLPRGVEVDAIDMERKWEFEPLVSVGDVVRAGHALGTTQEGHVTHKVMVPFGEYAPLKVSWTRAGNYTVRDDQTINLLDYGCVRIFNGGFVKGVVASDQFRLKRVPAETG